MNQPTSFVAFSGAKDTVFAIVGNGLFRSTDAGFNWTTLYLREPGTPQPLISRLLFEPNNPLVVYAPSETGDGTFWRSNDGGDTWQTANKGLPGEGGTMSGCTFYGAQSAVIYCALGPALYRTGNGGEEWTRVASFPTITPVTHFAIDPRDPTFLMFAQENLIQYSFNEGGTWERSRIPLPITNGFVTGMVFDPLDSNFLYVSVVAERGAGLYRTNNRGNNFILAASSARFQPISIFFGPGGLLYAPSATNASFHVCTRLQENAAACGEVPINTGGGPVTLSYDRLTPGRVYASTARGLWRSADGGGAWDLIWGAVKPTLSVPVRPYEFELSAGQQGALELPLRVVETQSWQVQLNTSTSGEPWLQLVEGAGSTPSNASVRVQAGQLAQGVYNATITIRSTQAANAPLTVPVKLTVRAPAVDPGYRVATFAGSGSVGTFGDEGLATRAAINLPDSIAALPGGGVVFTDTGNHALRSVDANGVIHRFAGRYQPGFGGDKGDALLASLRGPRGLAADSTGRVLFVDSDNQRMRVVASGLIDTYSVLTTNARAVAISSTGRIVVALPTLHAVAEVAGGDRLVIIAGTLVPGFRGEGGIATNARLSSPRDVWFDAAGNLYIADTDNHRIRVVGASDRIIRTVAGSGLGGFQGDSGRAIDVALNRPVAVTVDSAGAIYIIDSVNNRIRAVSPDGQLRTIAGNGSPGFAGEDAPALEARFGDPTDILALADGSLLITDTLNNRIRRLRPPVSGGRPAISQGGVVSAADGRIGIAPGGLFSVYGINFGTDTATASEIPWPDSLAEVSITMNGRPAPLYFVSPGQINGQVPFEIAPGNVDVVVTVKGVASDTMRVNARAAAPGIFLAVNQDGSLNSAANPARIGQAVIVYMTGQGGVDNAVATGQAAQADPLSRATLPFSARIGNMNANVVFLGLSPGFVGLSQANVIVPQLFSGEHNIEINVNGVVSNQARIRVAQ